MAGLDNYLSTLKDNTGIAGGYNAGIRDRASLDSTLADLAQKQATTERYTGETPSYLQKSQAQATSADLANAQPQADVAAGVPGQRAQANLGDAKVSALKAQQALQQMPPEHRAKLLDAIHKGNMQMLDLVEQTLTQTSDVPTTISTIEQQYPEVTKDPSWNAEKATVAKMAPQEALNYIRNMKAKLASSSAYGSSEMQGKMIMQDQEQAGRERLANIQGQYGLKEAQQRASSTASKPTSDQFLYEQIKAANPGMSEPELANAFVQARTITTKETPSILSPTGTVTTTTRKGSAGQGGAPDIRSMVEASGAKYEPNKFDYRINPETGKVQKKPKGN